LIRERKDKKWTMANRTLLLLLTAVGVTAAHAQDSLPVQLTNCLQIPGVLQRLACYDRVAHSVSPPPLGVPAPKPVVRAVPPYAAPPVAAPAPPSGLGSEHLPRTASVRRASEMVAGVASISYDARGHFTVALDNGQIWRQLEGDTAVLQGARNSTVRISRGALGSYDLNIVGHNATYRVLRLQ
jgi:hypothetical protein